MANGDSLAPTLYPDRYYVVELRMADGELITTVAQYKGLHTDEESGELVPVFHGYETSIIGGYVDYMKVIREIKEG